MNNKCTINLQIVSKYDFKHLFSYRLLYYIMSNYDINTKTVCINKQDLISKYNTTNYSIDSAINKLIDNNVIKIYKYHKSQYKINNKVFIKFE